MESRMNIGKIIQRMMSPTLRLFMLLASLQSIASAPAPLLQDNTMILKNLTGRSTVPLPSWSDSYSVGNSCYCASTFDHGVGDIAVKTPLSRSPMTVRQVCNLLGPGPGSTNRPKYNDIQCGNGPPYASTVRRTSDEILCPGRTEYGIEGCKFIGPKWNFQPLLPTQARPTAPTPVSRLPPSPLLSVATMSQVSYFNWWNANNNTLVRKLTNGHKFCESKYTFAIEAISKNNLQPVTIVVSGALSSSITEKKPPYFSFGNGGTDVYGKVFSVGNYTVTAYPNDNAIQGRLTIKFQVTKC